MNFVSKDIHLSNPFSATYLSGSISPLGKHFHNPCRIKILPYLPAYEVILSLKISPPPQSPSIVAMYAVHHDLRRKYSQY
jgi:hypothetical protein